MSRVKLYLWMVAGEFTKQNFKNLTLKKTYNRIGGKNHLRGLVVGVKSNILDTFYNETKV
jgi:hypothetical protein